MYDFEPFVPLVLPSGIDPIRMAKANIRLSFPLWYRRQNV